MPDTQVYVILLSMKPDKKFSREVVERHVQHLERLDNDGRLVLCGPFLDYDGGMVVVRVGAMEEAKKIAEADPFVSEGFESYEIRTLKQATRENGFLLDGD